MSKIRGEGKDLMIPKTLKISNSVIIVIIRNTCLKVACGRGNNLHEVENTNGERFLASMPTKFRKNVWIKRGNCEQYFLFSVILWLI